MHVQTARVQRKQCTSCPSEQRVFVNERLARRLVHIPHKGHVTTRDYDWYVNRPSGMRRSCRSSSRSNIPA